MDKLAICTACSLGKLREKQASYVYQTSMFINAEVTGSYEFQNWSVKTHRNCYSEILANKANRCLWAKLIWMQNRAYTSFLLQMSTPHCKLCTWLSSPSWLLTPFNPVWIYCPKLQDAITICTCLDLSYFNITTLRIPTFTFFLHNFGFWRKC